VDILVRELGAGETRLAFEAMRALRTRFDEEERFVAWVDAHQRPEGYRLVGSFEDGSEFPAAIAGFRVGHNTAWGYFLYVDDLSTLPASRGRGHGGALMGWLRDEAVRLGCDSLHLDSGLGADRADAHRLYFKSGLTITSHHFSAPTA
jgi:GNAT superfamily N-acetyltransferase